MSHTKRTLTASEFETSSNGDSYKEHIRHFVGASPDLKSTFDHVVDNLHLFTHYSRHLSSQIISPIILSSSAPNLFEGGSKACEYGDIRRSCFSQWHIRIILSAYLSKMDVGCSYKKLTMNLLIWFTSFNEKERMAERYVRFNVPELMRIAAMAVERNRCVNIIKITEGGFNKIFLLTMDDGY